MTGAEHPDDLIRLNEGGDNEDDATPLIRHRLETAPRGSLLDPEVVAWRFPIQEAAERRLLRPNLELVQESGAELHTDQGANLIRELSRSWLLWRDEFIESGIREADELWEPLVERQRGWMEETGLL